MKTKPALIVGNGVSRNPINLEKCIDKLVIYGCNALYRDFGGWNYMIAIDEGMIDELQRYHKNVGMIIIPDEDERWEPADYSPQRRRSNAGMNAMIEAIKRKHNMLYCIGFDFILKGDISTDNIYKNTANYGPETHATQNDNYHRIKYLEWFINKHKDVHFVFVIPDTGIHSVSEQFNNSLVDMAILVEDTASVNVDLITVSTFIRKVKNA